MILLKYKEINTQNDKRQLYKKIIFNYNYESHYMNMRYDFISMYTFLSFVILIIYFIYIF